MIDVPTTLDAVLDPEWLSEALDDIGDERPHRRGRGGRFLEDARAEGAVPGHGRARRRCAPSTRAYCVKAHLDGSPGADILSEARFYGELAPRSRRPHAARLLRRGRRRRRSRRSSSWTTSSRNGGRFLNAQTPYSLDTDPRHARSAGAAPRRDVGLRRGRRPRLAEPARRDAWPTCFPIDLLQSLLDDGRGPDVAPELRSAANVAEAMRRTGAHEITCVIHGDPHSGNSYLDADGPSVLARLADRAARQLGDRHQLPPRDRPRRRDATGRTRPSCSGTTSASSSRCGAPAPAWDDAWEQYTLGFSYGYFLWVITRISSRAVVLIHIPRLAAALTDHDTFRRLGVV